MKRRLVPFLRDPDTRDEPLVLDAVTREEGAEVMEGTLRNPRSGRAFAIRGGVPRLLPRALDALSTEVAAGFGWEWTRFSELRPEYTQQFLDWVAPLAPRDFADKRVFEGGCGKGRHTAAVAGFGAREVFALDLGAAVDAAFHNAGRLPNVHVVQGDLTRPPFQPGCAEVAFSVGVLHHLPTPREGFGALVELLAPGGRLAVWVYGLEGNEWIVRWVDPVRTRVTSRLPRPLLRELARPVGYALAAASRALYRPLATRASPTSRALYTRLPYRDYLTYIARLSVRDVHLIVFDQLVTPVAHYLARDEVARWFADDPRLTAVAIEPHNANSWRARAVRVDDPLPAR